MGPIVLPYYSHKKTQLCGKIMGLGVSSLGAPINSMDHLLSLVGCRGGFALPNAAWVVIMTWSSQRLIPTDALQSKSLVVWKHANCFCLPSVMFQLAARGKHSFDWISATHVFNLVWTVIIINILCYLVYYGIFVVYINIYTYMIIYICDYIYGISNQSFCWIAEQNCPVVRQYYPTENAAHARALELRRSTGIAHHIRCATMSGTW